MSAEKEIILSAESDEVGTDSLIRERLKVIVDHLGGPKKAAERAQIGRSTLWKWLEGEARPPLNAIAILCAESSYSLDWLTGLPNSGPSAGEEYTAIPRFTVEASAGPGVLAETEETVGALSFRRDWLRRRGINPSAAAALTVRGDSMEPTIRDGDTLLLDTSIDQVKDNGIYVIVLDGMVVVKRVHMAHEGSITLISDNQLYPPETIPATEVPEVRFAGRVMWFGRSI